MPTASIAARAGILALTTGVAVSSTDAIVEVRNIRLRVTHDQLNAASNDSSGWDEFIRGQRGWTFSAESLYTPSSGTTARVFADAILSDAALTGRFFPSTAASATHNYSGTAHITDFELAGDTNGLWIYTISGQGTGALTYSTST